MEHDEEETVSTKKTIIKMSTSDIDQSWKLVDIVTLRPPIGWKNLFSKLGPSVAHIEKCISNDDYLPLKKDIFNAYHLTPLSKVKVVIIGQDPYHTLYKDKPQAVGLAFSTPRDAPLQPSVKNIFVELANTYPDFESPGHGDLTEWARQGVLLLNTSLTTIEGIPGAHQQIWFGVIQKTFKEITEHRPKSVVLLWGKQAEKIKPFLGNLKSLIAAHPSPFSAHKGFFGCNHFNQANEYLMENGITPINWSKFD